MEPFTSSLRKIARAKEHLAEFEREVRVFLQTNPREMIIEPDPQEAQHVIHKVRFKHSLPLSLIDAAVDAIYNLRTSLDSAVYEIALTAAVFTGKIKPKKEQFFPFAGGSVEFENNLKGRCQDVPEEIYPVFRAFEPYKGGDDVLWALNRLSNIDKHGLLTISLNSELGDVTGVGGMVRMYVNPVWDRNKNEIEIGTFVRNSQLNYKAQIALSITFNEVEVIAGEPALRVLDYCTDKVERILLCLESETRRRRTPIRAGSARILLRSSKQDKTEKPRCKLDQGFPLPADFLRTHFVPAGRIGECPRRFPQRFED
jgi:hypothetical protein